MVSLFNSCRVVHEQHGGAAAEFDADGVEEMAEKVAEEGVSTWQQHNRLQSQLGRNWRQL
eukprot:5368745-Pleurochrysis_carterae.AAC.1